MINRVDISAYRNRTLIGLIVLVVVGSAITAPVAGGSATLSASSDAAEDGPSVETTWFDWFGDSAVIAAANLTDLGDATEANVSLEYRVNGTDEWDASQTKSANATGPIVWELTGLEPETEYEYRAVAATDAGIDRGEILTFETPWDRPAATTEAAVDVGEDEATLTANVTDFGDDDSVDVWFSYDPVDSGNWMSEWEETPTQTVDSPGVVTQRVTDLEPDTTYEFTAHVRNDRGQGYSTGYEEFTTDAPFVLETDSAIDVTASNATLTGSVVDLGGADAATTWFEYRERGDDWVRTDAADVDSAGQVDVDVTDLEPATDYEFRLVGEATDGDRDAGATASFRTLADPVVETGSPTTVDETSATVTGELVDLGGADEATVAVQYRAAGEWAWSETGEETLTATGSFEVSVSDLEPETEYEYRAVVRADGVTETGATETLTTDAATHEPTVEALSGTEDSPPNPHAELTVDWRVADEDGDLSSVTVTIRDGNDRVVDRTVASVGGTVADGSVAESVKHGAGDTYDVTLEVTDEEGAVATAQTVIEA